MRNDPDQEGLMLGSKASLGGLGVDFAAREPTNASAEPTTATQGFDVRVTPVHKILKPAPILQPNSAPNRAAGSQFSQNANLFRRFTPPLRCVLGSKRLRIVSPNNVVDASKIFVKPSSITVTLHGLASTMDATARNLCKELETLDDAAAASGSPAISAMGFKNGTALITPSPMSIHTPMAPYKPSASFPLAPSSSDGASVTEAPRQRKRGGAFERSLAPSEPRAKPDAVVPFAGDACAPAGPESAVGPEGTHLASGKAPKRSLFEVAHEAGGATSDAAPPMDPVQMAPQLDPVQAAPRLDPPQLNKRRRVRATPRDGEMHDDAPRAKLAAARPEARVATLAAPASRSSKLRLQVDPFAFE